MGRLQISPYARLGLFNSRPTPRNKERNVIFRSEPVQEHYFDEGTQEQKRYYIGSARNEPIEKLFRFQALSSPI